MKSVAKDLVILLNNKLLFICFVLFCCPGFSQTDSISKASDYIENYNDYLSSRFSISNSYQSFNVDGDNMQFTLSPNQQIKSTLTLMFRFIEIDLGYTPTFLKFNKDNDIKGKTKSFNLGTRFYFKRWMQNLQLMSNKGYYVDGAQIGIDENLFFSNLKIVKFGGSTSYVFNPNYSFRAIYSQNEWQKKSAGSWVPSLSYYYTKITNGTPGTDYNIDIAIGPGYFYNLVLHDRFLISGGLSGGVGYSGTKSKYRDGKPEEKSGGISWQAQYRVAAAYNGKQFYSGANFSFNSFYHNSGPGINLADQQHYLEFYIGYRFRVPDKYLKKMDTFIETQEKKWID